jgi:predicted RNA-binding protein YlqC (UPF0109 family)
MAKYQDQEFVEFLVKSIVSEPDKVEVSRKVDEMGVLLEVKVAPSDMGMLIGRSGATAKAIRTLVRIVGIRNNARVNLRIIEPEGSTHVRSDGVRNDGEKTKNVDDVVNDIGL